MIVCLVPVICLVSIWIALINPMQFCFNVAQDNRIIETNYIAIAKYWNGRKVGKCNPQRIFAVSPKDK